MASSLSGHRCAWVSSVVLTEACRSRAWTTFTFAPRRSAATRSSALAPRCHPRGGVDPLVQLARGTLASASTTSAEMTRAMPSSSPTTVIEVVDVSARLIDGQLEDPDALWRRVPLVRVLRSHARCIAGWSSAPVCERQAQITTRVPAGAGISGSVTSSPSTCDRHDLSR